MLKKIDSLLISSFLPPFFLAFLVALFVLIMQTIWLVIDDIMGKGVGIFLILEVLGYMCVTLFPLALPIGILISSVMVFGNLSERYELPALKSAGVSLTRIMAPLMLITLLVAAFSFLCSNHLIPVANLKFKTRMYNIKKQKPTLSIMEGVFNDDFPGMTIRVGRKDEDGQGIHDILIYNQNNDHSGNLNLVRAAHGRMFTSADERGFILQLFDGHRYEETKSSIKSKYPFLKSHFEECEIIFDLSSFESNHADEDQLKEHYDMLSVRQLNIRADTLRLDVERILDKAIPYIIPKFTKPKLVNKKKKSKISYGTQPDMLVLNKGGNSFIACFDPEALPILLNKVKSNLSRMKPNVQRQKDNYKQMKIIRARHIYAMNFKFASAIICFIFLFIGAPMGAIIRKGGYGYPLLITILFFMSYMVLTITFKETMKVGGMDPFLAAWLPVLILSPIGTILTIKAMNDSKFVDFDRIRKLFALLQR